MNKNIEIETITDKVLNEILKHTNEENQAPMPNYVIDEICNKLKMEKKSLEYHINKLKQKKTIEETIIETHGEYKVTIYKIKEGLKKIKPKLTKQTS